MLLLVTARSFDVSEDETTRKCSYPDNNLSIIIGKMFSLDQSQLDYLLSSNSNP